MPGCKLVLECISVKGFCPIYEVGDKVTFEEPRLVIEETDEYCIGGLTSILPFYRPLVRGISPQELGLTEGIVACHAAALDRPAAHGTVFFKIKQIPLTETFEDRWDKDLERKGIKGDTSVIRREHWPKDPDKP